MVTIGLDVTDQRRAEQALRLAQTAVDRSADLIFWIDQSAKFLYVNDAACQRLGYTRDELHGMTVADIDPECQWDRWPAHWEDLRQKGMIRFERRHQGKSGETYPVEVVANFVVVDGREYYFSFVRDISDRKRSYSLLQAAMNSVTDGLLIVDRQEQSPVPTNGSCTSGASSDAHGQRRRRGTAELCRGPAHGTGNVFTKSPRVVRTSRPRKFRCTEL